MVELGPVGDHDDEMELQQLINNHYIHTRSQVAETVLVKWDEFLPKFIKVIPLEYKKVLEEQKNQVTYGKDPEDRG